MVVSQLTSSSVIAFFLFQLVISSLFTSFVFAESSLTETKIPIVLIPAITQNILTIVSFLIGTSSFVLGLRIQHISRSSSSSSPLWKIMNKYFDMLILALVIPAIILIIFGLSSLAIKWILGILPTCYYYLSSLFLRGQYYFWSAGYGYCPSSLRITVILRSTFSPEVCHLLY